jgi:hypothetical protein
MKFFGELAWLTIREREDVTVGISYRKTTVKDP